VLLAVIGTGAGFVVFWATCLALGRRTQRDLSYGACLRNIDRLERELFPERFKGEPKIEWLEDVSRV
jgi:hypothetical protein